MADKTCRRKRSDGNMIADNFVSPAKGKDQQPVPAVHVDVNRERASAQALAFLGEGYSDADRLAIM